MKQILFIAAVCLSLSANGQHRLNIGTEGYVTIDGQNYKRGDLRSQYNFAISDSTMGIIYATDRTFLISPVNKAGYYNADSSAAYPSMKALRTWMNSRFENYVKP